MSQSGLRNPAGAATVYSMYAADGTLLYVGATTKGFDRIHIHAGVQTWWREVCTVAVQHFANIYQARAEEEKRIRTLKPRHTSEYICRPVQEDEIRLLRQELGLTQAELAERLGVELRLVMLWESGRRWPHAGAWKTMRSLLALHRGNPIVGGPPQLNTSVAVSDLRVGMQITRPVGSVSEVLAITRVGPQSVIITERCLETGIQLDSLMFLYSSIQARWPEQETDEQRQARSLRWFKYHQPKKVEK